MFVLTIDQKGSRSGRDRVPDLLDLLGGLPMELPFERSVGDEVQGLSTDAGTAVDAALTCAANALDKADQTGFAPYWVRPHNRWTPLL